MVVRRVLTSGDVCYVDGRIGVNVSRGVVGSKPLVKYCGRERQEIYRLREKGRVMALDLAKLYVAGLFDPFEAFDFFNYLGLLDVKQGFDDDQKRIIFG
jgi:hypothetical protein